MHGSLLVNYHMFIKSLLVFLQMFSKKHSRILDFSVEKSQ